MKNLETPGKTGRVDRYALLFSLLMAIGKIINKNYF